MLGRLANVIYYFCVLIGVCIFAYWALLGIGEYINQSHIDALIGGPLIGFLLLSISIIIGWSVRYIITGNKSLL